MYQGNPSLRAAGEKVVITKEQIDEYVKCKNDIIYFAEHYFYIQTIDGGRQLVKLYGYQKKVLKAMSDPPNGKKHICLLAARQVGKGMMTSIFLTHYSLFEKDDNIIILANKEATAKDTLEKIKIAIQKFPLWLQKGVVNGGWNKNSVQFENGMTILAASSSSDSVRGKTSGLVFLDEASFVPPHIWEQFWNSVYSIMSSGKKSKLIMVSTPKGLNHFYEIYSKAVKGENNFYPIKITWRDHPDRDEKWAEDTKKDMTTQAFLQEHEGQFQGSSNTLITPGILERIDTRTPIENKYNGAMLIYELPIDGCEYVLGVDPSRGTGSDYSVVQVLKINSEKDIDQVAVFRNNETDPETFAGICVGISEYYNKAEMMVESNDIGELVCDKIFYEYDCDKLINFDKNGLGIRSTKKTKLAGVLLMKKYIENGWLQINDMKTLYELSRFEEKNPGVWQAIGQNENDDTVCSMWIGLYYLISGFYDATTNAKDSGKSNKGSDEEVPTFLSSEDIHSNFFGNAFSNDFQDTPQNFQNSQNNDIYFGNGYN